MSLNSFGWGQRPPSATVPRAVGLALFIVLAIVTMELAARVDDFVRYSAPLTRNYDFDRLFTFDGRVMRGVPNARYAKWSLNSLGLRGSEPQPTDGTQRVIVYGASEVFGVYETNGKEFPRVLEEQLRTLGGSDWVSVYNAGIPGMRIGSGTEYLGGLVKKVASQVVVLYPTPTHYIGVTHPNCGRPPRFAAANTGVEIPASRLLGKAIDRLKESLPRAVLTLSRRWAIAWAMRGREPLSAVDPASLVALEVDIKCAVQAVRTAGARPVLVTHANRFGTSIRRDDADWLTGWRMQYPELSEVGFVDLENRANSVIRKVATAEGVLLLDAEVAIGGHPEWFADHAHFSDEGSQHMGRFLAEGMLAQRVITSPRTAD